MRRLSIKKLLKSKLQTIITIICSFLLFIIISDIIYYSFIIDIKKLERSNPTTTAFMKYRQKQWFSKKKKTKLKHHWVTYRRISPALVRAVIISEDAKFWKHNGFDFKAIEAAIEENVKSKTLKFGASTISQQVSKNLYLSPSKSPLRKFNEAILTYRLEKTLSKKRILEIYLNIAEWGDGVFGAEAASLYYFKIHARDLSSYQAALLAVVLPSPLKMDPAHPSRYIRRRAARINKYIIRY